LSKRLSLFKIILPFLFLALFLYVFNAEYVSAFLNQRGIKDKGIKYIWEYVDNTLSHFLNYNHKAELSSEIFLLEDYDDKIFPDHLGDMKLNKVVKGSKAIMDIHDFHGTNVDIFRAFIPHYQGVNQEAVVWIIESNETGANVLLISIDEKISENELFCNYETWIKDNIKIHEAERNGWFNYYYQKENQVYWVSIRSAVPSETFSLVFEAL